MDGIHDLGGRQGFGSIDTGESDEQFHHRWEARVRGMVIAMSGAPDWNLDWFRHCRELIAPEDYLTRPYFDQWLQAYAAMMVNSGIATVEELASGTSSGASPGLARPMSVAEVKTTNLGAKRFDGPAEALPVFAPGDSVRPRSHGTSGHTRLPAYARGRAGTVTRHHGAHVLPDSNAMGDKRFEHLYTVAFDAAELWPEARGRRDTVSLNLWESYLEPR